MRGTTICTCQHSISKPGLRSSLEVRDPALQIAAGNKVTGSCSYIRISPSIHLKSEQYGLATLTISGNWFGLPENQNVPQSNLFILKVTCQLPVMIFIFLSNFFYALSSKSHFLCKEVGLSVFYERQIHLYALNSRLRTTLVINHHHKPHVCFLLALCGLYQPSIHLFCGL